jgi:ABC-type sulfate transport system permease component
LLVVGVVLPIFIISWFTDYGIAMAVVGAILIIVSQILYREYRLRSTQQQKTN